MPLAAVPQPASRDRAPDLRDAVSDALADMTWLQKSDQALAALAKRQAEEIEKAIDRADELDEQHRDIDRDDVGAYKRLKALEAMCDLTKTVGWLGPQVQGVLRDLGGTPAARLALKPDKPVGGRLAQLRAGAQQAPPGEPTPPAKRPPARRRAATNGDA